ncbi:hypothetical protein EYF80_016766 [Liparis tanakae]|uniref:Uncharacterized protein n=1 Tax=Liparis tanakae TaxID=230148 RepID=A0A4Z2I4I1_9TELE|nr:hypothetical protein EYF80_016766 [Liparis tanakae]
MRVIIISHAALFKRLLRLRNPTNESHSSCLTEVLLFASAVHSQLAELASLLVAKICYPLHKPIGGRPRVSPEHTEEDEEYRWRCDHGDSTGELQEMT